MIYDSAPRGRPWSEIIADLEKQFPPTSLYKVRVPLTEIMPDGRRKSGIAETIVRAPTPEDAKKIEWRNNYLILREAKSRREIVGHSIDYAGTTAEPYDGPDPADALRMSDEEIARELGLA